MKEFTEAVYTQEGLMTFGFELECLVQRSKKLEVTNILNQIAEVTRVGSVITPFKVGRDTSIWQGTEDKGVWEDARNSGTFPEYLELEFKSPPIPINPANIAKVITVLKLLFMKKNAKGYSYVFTNKSCGFHVHFGFAHTENFLEENAWVMFQLLLNITLLEKYKKMQWKNKKLTFSDAGYASFTKLAAEAREKLLRIETIRGHKVKALEEIKDNLMRFNMSNSLSRSEKWKVLRFHPMGTLEWRGPRAFMDFKEMIIDTVPKFFKEYVYPMAQLFASLSDNTHIVFDLKQLKDPKLNNRSKLFNQKILITKKEFIKKIQEDNGGDGGSLDDTNEHIRALRRLNDTKRKESDMARILKIIEMPLNSENIKFLIENPWIGKTIGKRTKKDFPYDNPLEPIMGFYGYDSIKLFERWFKLAGLKYPIQDNEGFVISEENTKITNSVIKQIICLEHDFYFTDNTIDTLIISEHLKWAGGKIIKGNTIKNLFLTEDEQLTGTLSGNNIENLYVETAAFSKLTKHSPKGMKEHIENENRDLIRRIKIFKRTNKVNRIFITTGNGREIHEFKEN